jgi:hypothetical protein
MSMTIKDITAAQQAAAKKEASNRAATRQAASKISQIVGGNFILPGENAQQFHQAYAAALVELGAQTQLQIYLAEQIFHSMWWIRRYELQKRASLISEMVKILRSPGLAELAGLDLTELLEAGRWDDPAVLNEIKSKGFTAQSLLQRAGVRQQEELMRLDQGIALKAHTLAQLQKSYEALVSRSVMQERLKLQNDLLKRDLLAIDTPIVKDLKAEAQQLAHEKNAWEPDYDER